MINLILVNGKPNGMKFKVLPQEIQNKIMGNYRTLSEAAYCIINNVQQKLCSCGKPANFINFTQGYGKYCSKNCTAKRDKIYDIKKEKDYSILDNNNNINIYSINIIKEKLKNIVFNKNNQINGNIEMIDIAHIDINLYFSIIKYTKFLNSKSLSKIVWHIFNNIQYVPICSCGNQLNYINFNRGYKKYCSDKCACNDIDYITNRSNTRKSKDNWLKNWLDKKDATYLSKTGYKCSFNNPESIKKKEITCIERYGSAHPMHNEKIFNKVMRKSFRLKEYILPSGSVIYLQGYEHFYANQFINEANESYYVFNKINLNILYSYKDKNRKYYPDFFNKQTNTIIEVKSEYTIHCDTERNLEKFKSVEKYGYNLEVCVFDKNGKIINKFISSSDYKNFIDKIGL